MTPPLPFCRKTNQAGDSPLDAAPENPGREIEDPMPATGVETQSPRNEDEPVGEAWIAEEISEGPGLSNPIPAHTTQLPPPADPAVRAAVA